MASAGIEAGKIFVRWLSENPSTIRPFECIIDVDPYNTPLGVEILGFTEQLLSKPPPCDQDTIPRWSYDAEVDAFYLRLGSGRSLNPIKTVGTASIGSSGEVLGFEIDLPDFDDSLR